MSRSRKPIWQQLMQRQVHFITRLKKRATIEVEQVFTDGYVLRDRLIRIGSGTKKTPVLSLRLIEVRSDKLWHAYLTSVLEPEHLPRMWWPICIAKDGALKRL